MDMIKNRPCGRSCSNGCLGITSPGLKMGMLPGPYAQSALGAVDKAC